MNLIPNRMFNTIQVHVIDHSLDEIGIPDQNLLVLPGDVSIVLRRNVLGFAVDDDQMKTVAQSLPSIPGEDDTDDFIDRVRHRFQVKLKEIMKMPRHFITNDKIWPPYPGFILKK